MQDNLSGIEHPVSVKVLQIPWDETWRNAFTGKMETPYLGHVFGFHEGEGLFVHMKGSSSR